MRKKLLLLSICFVLGLITVKAQWTSSILETNGYEGRAVSANGKYIVGTSRAVFNYGLLGLSGYSGFIYDVETKETQWLTSNPDMTSENPEYDKTGGFTAVSNNGIIVGYAFDERYTVNMMDEGQSYIYPLTTAAVWVDGIMSRLEIDNPSRYNNAGAYTDGSYASCISADGKFIGGYIAYGQFSQFIPCGWTYNETTKNWDFQLYSYSDLAPNPRQDDDYLSGARIFSINNQGHAVGELMYQYHTAPIVWTSTTECYLIGQDEFGDRLHGSASSISENGKYVGLSIGDFGYTTFRMSPAVYSTETKEYVKLGEVENAYAVDAFVTNDGYATGTYSMNAGQNMIGKRSYFYTPANGRIELGNYFKEAKLSPSINFNWTSSSSGAEVKAISADGTRILGFLENATMGGGDYSTSWMTYIQNPDVLVLRPATNLKAEVVIYKNAFFNEYVHDVILTWDAPNETREGYSPNYYKIYNNGEYTEMVTEVKGVTSFTFIGALEGGNRSYQISTLYNAELEDWENLSWGTESVLSEALSVTIPDDFSFGLNENFETSSFGTNYWSNEQLIDSRNQYSWKVQEDFGITGSYTASIIVGNDDNEYSNALVSRPMTATPVVQRNRKAYLTYAKRMDYVYNSAVTEYDKSGDTLSVEVSVYGTDEWVPVMVHPLSKGINYKWMPEYIDITDYIGDDLFQVRFRAHGENKTGLVWYLNLIRVAYEGDILVEDLPTPAGIKGYSVPGKVHATWPNTADNYELTYMSDPNDAMGYMTAGNYGEEIIIANLYDEDDLKPYDGMYLTSVTGYIEGTEAFVTGSVVIYEDEVQIRKQAVVITAYEDMVFVLDEPVLIDSSKKLKIGLWLDEHNMYSAPLTFQYTRSYVPGKSDIFSDDKGKTWQSYSEWWTANPNLWGQYQTEVEGYACWTIWGNITESATPEVNGKEEGSMLYGYTLYRDDERINVLREQNYYNDTNFDTEKEYCYSLQAYYLDGTFSYVSEDIFCADVELIPDNISQEKVKALLVYPNPANDFITVNGEVVKVTVMDLSGKVVLESVQNPIAVGALSEGVYFVKIQTEEKTVTEKIMIKR